MKVLLIEDDTDTSAYVSQGLEEHGDVVDHAANGRNGLFLAAGEAYDVLIIDRILPGLDGLCVVKTLRATDVQTPVLFLTTMSGIGQRIEGLEAGGDNYLTKPFTLAEFLARVNALARRRPMAKVKTVLKVAGLKLDLIGRKVRRDVRDVEIQPREFKLLKYLMRNAGRVVTRTKLLVNVWDFRFDPNTNIVETHVSRLCSKVDRGYERELIETVRGAGYCLRAPQA